MFTRRILQKDLIEPIIILGVERSGTTLLYSILSNHPELYWFSRLDSILTGAPLMACLIRQLASTVFKDVHIASVGTISQTRGLLPPSECLPYWRRIFGWGDENDYLIEDDSFDEQDLDPERAKTVRFDLRKRLYFLHRTRLLFKQPGFSLKIRYLNALFPDALFIHVIRHPFDNLASLVDAKERSGENFWGTKIPGWRGLIGRDRVSQAALQMKTVLETIENDTRTIEKASQRFLTVKYEDLQGSPDTSLEEILAFCKLDMTPAIQSSALGIEPRNRRKKQASFSVSSEVSEILSRISSRYGYEPAHRS
jgi:hypothetical protein